MQSSTTLGERLVGWKNRSLCGSLAFTIVAGIAYCISLGDRIRYPDELQYLRIARNLADHAWFTVDGVHNTAFPPPGYPLVLGAFKWLGASTVVLRSLNVLFVVVTVWAVWWLANRISGPAAATVAAPLAALYPLSFYTMGTLYPQTMGAALLAVGLVAIVQIRDRVNPYWCGLGGGLAFGLLILAIPTFAVALFIATVWLLVKDRRWGPVVVLVASAALLPTVWTVRNAVVMDAFIPIASSKDNLLLGNSEHATANSGILVDLSKYTAVIKREHMGEVEASNYMTRAAIDWIKANPGKAAVLYVEKTLNYFSPFDQLSDPRNNSVPQQILATITYLPLLFLFLWRLCLWRRDPPDSVEKLLIAIYLISAPAQAIFTTRVRYRVPLDPLLLVVVAAFVARWLLNRHRRSSGVPTADIDEEIAAATTQATGVRDAESMIEGSPG